MSPGIRLGDLPPFYDLDEYVFQELCRDLLDAEPDVATCEVYGERGQRQDGIDLRAYCKEGNGIVVGQCKCYRDFPPAEIRQASEDFLAHWNRWAHENVIRFVLCVACDMSNRHRQDELDKQKKRFAELGIGYELWSAATIRNKLRPYPGIVANYCTPAEHWVQVICGSDTPPFQTVSEQGKRTATVVNTALITMVEQLTERLSSQTEHELERMRIAWREGGKREADAWLTALKNDAVHWQGLSPTIKAKVLCFEASLVLDRPGGVRQAWVLVEEAHGLDPAEPQARLRALIAYRDTGPEAALPLLRGQEDVESRNLHAAILLEVGRADECLALLDFAAMSLALPDQRLIPSAETFRIRALAHLMTREVVQAQIDIQKALALEPRWERIRYAAAIIWYCSAVVPIALPSRLLPWPEPVDWAMLKRDDASLRALREAAQVFRELTNMPEREPEKRQILATWHLACLLNDPDRQEEALAYCRTILQAEPMHDRAIAWVVVRHLDVDLTPSISALTRLIQANQAHVLHILALAGCYFISNQAQQAVELLQDTRAFFTAHEAEALWTFWYAQALAVNGTPDVALRTFDLVDSTVELRRMRTIILHTLAQETEDWQPILQHLESSYAATHHPLFLLEQCEVLASQQAWPTIADRAQQLVDEVGTSTALRLAAIAAYQAKRFRLCLTLLDDHAHFFAQNKLPGELRRLRVLCQDVLDIPQALTEAERLTHEEPTAENLLALARLYFTHGDLRSLALLARQLSVIPDLPAEPVLRMARLVRLEDHALAVTLWRKATTQELPDALVGEAFSQGYQLGLDEELRPLSEKMLQLGRQGSWGLHSMTMEELRAWAAQRHKLGVQLDESYRQGTIPIHIVEERVRRPLVDFYHRFLTEYERTPDPLRQFALMIRHGGRTPVPEVPDHGPQWRLHLDVTALLLANHLELLPIVEGAFSPLHIPATLIPALVEMLDRLQPQQPSRLILYQQIVDLAERGLCHIAPDGLPPVYEQTPLAEELAAKLGSAWVALFDRTRASRGYLVDFLPLHTRDGCDASAALPEETAQYVVNCRAVLEALRQQGPLSAEEYDRALQGLGQQGHCEVSPVLPVQGTALFCHSTIPEVLAEAQLLHTVCERFVVSLEQRELDRIRNELHEHKRNQETAAWLRMLLDRLGEGVRAGRYITLPPVLRPEVESETTEKTTLASQGVLDLCQLQGQPGDVLWIDDRYAHSYTYQQHGLPIIGINEVLKALVTMGVLHDGEYYAYLNRLRAANVRFIPVEQGELLHHFRQAIIEQGLLIETHALRALRRSIAACLAQGHMLQRAPMPEGAPNPHGEIAFLINVCSVVRETLMAVWAEESADDLTCQARAEWLLTNLYVDHLSMFTLASLPRSEHNELYLSAVSLALLLSQAMPLPSSRHRQRLSVRHRYFDWLWRRVLQPRFAAEPDLPGMVADALKRSLTEGQDALTAIGPLPMIMGVLRHFFDDLPAPVQDALRRDPAFMTRIGLTSLRTAVLDGVVFDHVALWQAAREAINGREATIMPVNMTTEVRLHPVESSSNRYAVGFDHPVTGNGRVFTRSLLGLLRESPLEREATLHQNRPWLDCPSETFDQLVADIVAREEWLQGVERMEALCNSSATVYYARLHERLSTHDQLQYDDLLPPSADGLVRHLRLTTTADAQGARGMVQAVQSLLDHEGLLTACERLIGIPAPLPQMLLHMLAACPTDKKHAVIKHVLRAARSPVARMHVLHILLQCGEDVPAYSRLARRIISRLCTPAAKTEIGAFVAVLQWVNEHVSRWPETRPWSSFLRLAVTWTHAHRLFSIFVAVGASPAWLQEELEQHRPPISYETFVRNADYRLDVAHPSQIQYESFLLHGIAYGLGNTVPACMGTRMQDLCASVAFLMGDGQPSPALSLLRDTSQAPNALDAFLGGERSATLAPLLGHEAAQAFAQSSLHNLVSQAVHALMNGTENSAAWQLLYMVLGELLPYPEIVNQLKTAIAQTDFVRLNMQHQEAGWLAMHTAILQVSHLDDLGLADFIKDQLVGIAELLAKRHADALSLPTEGAEIFREPRQSCGWLLEWALHLCRATAPGRENSEEFIALLIRLIETWPCMNAFCQPLVQDFAETLPVALAQPFATLLVRLRAACVDQR